MYVFTKHVIFCNFFRANNIRYDFLPPYSPQLNPIEEVFSIFKNIYRSFRPFATTVNEMKNLIDSAMEILKCDRNFLSLYNHMMYNLNLAFLGNNLE